jgi:diphthamide synthase (EF-2-diphthine--ammonia ligase)
MSARERVLVAWSGGKNGAFTLHVLRQQGVAVAGLLTTVSPARRPS